MDKEAVRESVWDRLDETGVARFPFPPHGRIPNFDGAATAAESLTMTNPWRAATTIKINPDAPQRPVRRAALEAGKTCYMAVPRLTQPAPFLQLDPAMIDDIGEATTIAGSTTYGTPVHPDDLPPIDLIVSGSVAVDRDGTRIGKGEGYSDLEYAILRTYDRVDASTPVATTVHDQQLRDGPLTADAHDVQLDLIATPTTTIEVAGDRTQPDGIDWSLITEADRDAMPILAECWSTYQAEGSAE